MLFAGKLETLRLFVAHHNHQVNPFPTAAIREFVTRRASVSNHAAELRALVVSNDCDFPWLKSRINRVEYQGLYAGVDATSAFGYYIETVDFSEFDEDVFANEGNDAGHIHDHGYDTYFDETYGDGWAYDLF